MNIIDFNKNDFPISSRVLGFIQSEIILLEKFCTLSSGNYIISGLVTQGGVISAGYVCVNGEIMPCAGGSSAIAAVRVVTTNTVVNVNDKSYTKTTKELVFGAGEGQLMWNSFRPLPAMLSKTLFMDIGAWDMGANETKSINAPSWLSFSSILKIKGADAFVRSDNSEDLLSLRCSGTGYTVDGTIKIVGYRIDLNRNPAGQYNNAQFVNTAINRGYLKIYFE
jgi:hypothetical protein